LRQANYRVFPNPYDPTGVIVALPVAYENVKFDKVLDDKTGDTIEVNLESAVSQLERYKLLMDHYVDHNCSITVSYDPSEIPEIVEWIYANWDSYVGVSFILRNDPTKRPEDLGYPYLPQEVVTKREYDHYVSQLRPVNIDGGELVPDFEDCATGACPVR
jgi:ribonucleoside-triphosphate reductase